MRLAGLGILGVIGAVVTGVVLLIGNIAWGWFSGEANLRSFNHVRDTYQVAYDDINALKTLQDQACQFQTAASSTNNDVVKQQRLTQLLATKGAYFRVQREYDAYMADHFRGKLIHPHDLLVPSPDLDLSNC